MCQLGTAERSPSLRPISAFCKTKGEAKEAAEVFLFDWFGLVLLKTQKCSFFGRNLILSRGDVPCLHAKLQMAYSLIPDICMYSSYSQRSEVSPTKARVTHYFFFSEKNSLVKYIKIHMWNNLNKRWKYTGYLLIWCEKYNCILLLVFSLHTGFYLRLPASRDFLWLYTQGKSAKHLQKIILRSSNSQLYCILKNVVGFGAQPHPFSPY